RRQRADTGRSPPPHRSRRGRGARAGERNAPAGFHPRPERRPTGVPSRALNFVLTSEPEARGPRPEALSSYQPPPLAAPLSSFFLSSFFLSFFASPLSAGASAAAAKVGLVARNATARNDARMVFMGLSLV